MPRDRVEELLSIRQRSGKYRRMPSKYDLERLKDIWQRQLKGIDPTDELILIRVVTIVEVFLQHWIEVLIDHGDPYVERASKLKVDIKYDFAIAQSLQGGSITLGQLIAHSLSLNRIDSFSSIFGKLLDQDLFDAISSTQDLWRVKREGDGVGPIITDMAWIRRTLSRLFEVRHILVHELPAEKPHTLEQVVEFIDAATMFVHATDEELTFRLQGRYPFTQAEITQAARDQHKAAMVELDALCKEVALLTPEMPSRPKPVTIDRVQLHWLCYKETEAARQAEMYLGGTIRPSLYHFAAEASHGREFQNCASGLTGVLSVGVRRAFLTGGASRSAMATWLHRGAPLRLLFALPRSMSVLALVHLPLPEYGLPSARFRSGTR
jgi:hypothetical protein